MELEPEDKLCPNCAVIYDGVFKLMEDSLSFYTQVFIFSFELFEQEEFQIGTISSSM
jgi:hypothetical protein